MLDTSELIARADRVRDEASIEIAKAQELRKRSAALLNRIDAHLADIMERMDGTFPVTALKLAPGPQPRSAISSFSREQPDRT
jgi:hypothetical protein